MTDKESGCDQGSDISFMNDTHEEIETAEIEEEDYAGSKHTEE